MGSKALVDDCSDGCTELGEKFVENISGDIARNTTGLLCTCQLLVDLVYFKAGVITGLNSKFALYTERKSVNTEGFILLANFAEEISDYFRRFKFRESTLNMFWEIKVILERVTRPSQQSSSSSYPFVAFFPCLLNLLGDECFTFILDCIL